MAVQQSKKNKKKKARSVLPNPLVSKIIVQDQTELKSKLEAKIAKVFGKKSVSNESILATLSPEEKKSFQSKSKKERSEFLKAEKAKKRSEMNQDVLPKEYKSGIVVGLKQTLNMLEKDGLRSLMFDSSSNFEALKVLFDKGRIPMIPVPDLSDLVRRATDFPALCLGFPKVQDNTQVQEYFEDLVALTEGMAAPRVPKTPIKQPLPDVIPPKKTLSVPKKSLKLKCPLITLLKRESTKERIFQPHIVKEDNDDDFKGDFISFARSSPPPQKKIKFE